MSSDIRHTSSRLSEVQDGDPGSDVAIRVQNLSKCYHIYDKPRDRLMQMLARGRKQYFREFWALKEVSFDVKKGETVGIIGRNGSGKSTLLQMICGTLNPTSGNIQTHGRIAALLELGSGFNPEFTGRENVYMNAALLGLNKSEIDARYQDIVAFADIGGFIDQSVKTYSSGMMVRLAFAVIAHVDADILVVDEALAVGDVFFSQKCMRFFEGFRSAGGTVLFVSHDTAAVVKLCDRGIFLAHGAMHSSGPAEAVCKVYLEQLYDARSENVEDFESTDFYGDGRPSFGQKKEVLEFFANSQKQNHIFVSKFNTAGESFGAGGVKIVDACFFDIAGRPLSELTGETAVKLSVTLACAKHIKYPAVGLVIKDRLGQAVWTEGTTWAFDGQYGEGMLEFLPGDTVRVDFDHKVPILAEGEYAVALAVAEGYGHEHIQHHYLHEALVLHAVGRRLLHGISGLVDLKVAIRISRIHDPKSDFSETTA